MDTDDLKISDATPPAPLMVDHVQQPAQQPAEAPTFVPINPPPSDHHPLNTGLGTEHGDSAKTMVAKVNSGFAHVLAKLEELGASGVRTVKTAVAPADTSNMVSKDEHEKVKADLAAVSQRFDLLASRIEKFLGLEK